MLTASTCTPAMATPRNRGGQRKLPPVLIGYVVAILVGLALPGLAIVFYLGIRCI